MKKGDKGTKHCDKACGAFVFLAIILLAVSQLLGEKETYSSIPMSKKNGYCALSGANTPLCGPPGPGQEPGPLSPLCYPTPSHGVIHPYITTLNECDSDKDCNVKGTTPGSSYKHGKCFQCSNGKCGVYQLHNNVKKKVYVGDGACWCDGKYGCDGCPPVPSPTKASPTA